MVREETVMRMRAEAEVRELHRFFEKWMTGRLPDTDEAFARFSDVLAGGFHIVTPDGTIRTRAKLIARLREAHGSYTDPDRPFRVWVENHRHRLSLGKLCLVTYEEWQETPVGKRGRLSSALFRDRKDNPNGLEWLHVHEVWLSRA